MTMVEASEIEWKGRTGPFSLSVRPGVFSPTSTSRTLADALDWKTITAMLEPYDARETDAYPVMNRVGSVKNDDEGLIEPLI